MPCIGEAPTALWPRLILMEVEHTDRWDVDCLTAPFDAGYRVKPIGKKDVLLSR